MPLRLRWILPLIQTIVTILLLAAARWERPISAWDVPAVMLAKALSAPALVLPYAGAHVLNAAGIRTNAVTGAGPRFSMSIVLYETCYAAWARARVCHRLWHGRDPLLARQGAPWRHSRTIKEH